MWSSQSHSSSGISSASLPISESVKNVLRLKGGTCNHATVPYTLLPVLVCTPKKRTFPSTPSTPTRRKSLPQSAGSPRSFSPTPSPSQHPSQGSSPGSATVSKIETTTKEGPESSLIMEESYFEEIPWKPESLPKEYQTYENSSKYVAPPAGRTAGFQIYEDSSKSASTPPGYSQPSSPRSQLGASVSPSYVTPGHTPYDDTGKLSFRSTRTSPTESYRTPPGGRSRSLSSERPSGSRSSFVQGMQSGSTPAPVRPPTAPAFQIYEDPSKSVNASSGPCGPTSPCSSSGRTAGYQSYEDSQRYAPSPPGRTAGFQIYEDPSKSASTFSRSCGSSSPSSPNYSSPGNETYDVIPPQSRQMSSPSTTQRSSYKSSASKSASTFSGSCGSSSPCSPNYSSPGSETYDVIPPEFKQMFTHLTPQTPSFKRPADVRPEYETYDVISPQSRQMSSPSTTQRSSYKSSASKSASTFSGSCGSSSPCSPNYSSPGSETYDVIPPELKQRFTHLTPQTPSFKKTISKPTEPHERNLPPRNQDPNFLMVPQSRRSRRRSSDRSNRSRSRFNSRSFTEGIQDTSTPASLNTSIRPNAPGFQSSRSTSSASPQFSSYLSPGCMTQSTCQSEQTANSLSPQRLSFTSTICSPTTPHQRNLPPKNQDPNFLMVPRRRSRRRSSDESNRSRSRSNSRSFTREIQSTSAPASLNTSIRPNAPKFQMYVDPPSPAKSDRSMSSSATNSSFGDGGFSPHSSHSPLNESILSPLANTDQERLKIYEEATKHIKTQVEKLEQFRCMEELKAMQQERRREILEGRTISRPQRTQYNTIM